MNTKKFKAFIAISLALILMVSFTWGIEIQGYTEYLEVPRCGIDLGGMNLSGQVDGSMKGNTIINMLGTVGDCESLSNFNTYSTAEISIDKNIKTIGSSSIKVVATNANIEHYVQTTFNVEANKKYFLSGYITPNIGIGVIKGYAQNAQGSYIYTAVSDTTYEAGRVGCVLNVDGTTTGFNAIIRATIQKLPGNNIFSGTGESINIDGLMVVTLTNADEGLSIEQLMDRYNFVNGGKSVKPIGLYCVGQNLIRNGNGDEGTDGWVSATAENAPPRINHYGDFQISKGNQTSNDVNICQIVPLLEKRPFYMLGFNFYKKTGQNVIRANVTLYDRYNNQIGQTESYTIHKDSDYYPRAQIQIQSHFAAFAKIVIECIEVGDYYEVNNIKLTYDYYSSNEPAPYKNDYTFINEELRSLPDGTRDEINLFNTEFVRRTDKQVLNSSLAWDSFNNTQFTTITYATVPSWGIFRNVALGTTNINAYNDSLKLNPAISLSDNGKPQVVIAADGKLWIGIPKELIGGTSGYTNDLSGFIKYLEEKHTEIVYQLGKYQKYKINTKPLSFCEFGSIFMEKAIKNVSIYSSKISISDAQLPIQSLIYLNKYENGMTKYVNLSKVVLAQDGLSFTILGAKKGERYEYAYRYKEELCANPNVVCSIPLQEMGQLESNTQAINYYKDLLDNIQSRLSKLEADANSEIKLSGAPIQLNCSTNQSINVAVTAANVQDIGNCMFTLTYDPSMLQVTDLCVATPDKNLSEGLINGSNITILNNDMASGIITFKIDGEGQVGKWFGTVNTIEFTALTSGQTTVAYTIE